MRKRTIVAAVAGGLMLLAGPAFADGPTGSSEHHTSCDAQGNCTEVHDNNVKCGAGTAVPGPAGTVVISGLPSGGSPGTAGGLEVCSADSQVIQGRIIASGSATDQSGYVAADGDRDNPTQGQGYTRVDGSASGVGVRCASASSDKDATAPSPGDNQAACNPTT